MPTRQSQSASPPRAKRRSTVSKTAVRPKLKHGSAAVERAIPEGLMELIDLERGNLAKVESLLGCLSIAMEYGDEAEEGPHYPDVTYVARELVKRTVDGLDAVALQERLQRNKIRECLVLQWVDGACWALRADAGGAEFRGPTHNCPVLERCARRA